NPDEKDIEMSQQMKEPLHPVFRLDDVLDNQIVPGLGEHRNATVKTFEEGRTQCAPRKFAALDACLRQNAGSIEMIDRKMPERLFETVLQSCGERGFAGA